jgi:signal transduction histidine kinase
MEAWSGLRARVAINLAAAASLTFGFLALVSIVVMQRAMTDTDDAAMSSAATLVSANLGACRERGSSVVACQSTVLANARQSGFVVELHDRPPQFESRIVPGQNGRPAYLSVERGGLRQPTVEMQAPLGPMIRRTRAAITVMLLFLFLNAGVLVLVGTYMLNRGVVQRLVPITESMARIERFDLDDPLLASEGGDELGRMGGTLHRIRDRLREDKRRTTEYIAELEKTNRELRETREGLARSERLATVGRLAAGVAHEIGNPIAAILGYLEILRRGQGVSTPEYVDRIDREAKRVDRIVRDLIDFARPQPLVTGPVSLRQVIEGATRLVQPQPRWRAMELGVVVPEGLPLVNAQEHYAVQVLLNLLMNAADACDGKGRVTITARTAGDRVEVAVTDDGPGIKAEDASHVFDPFFTTKPPGEGVGLGLAICHRIMESFGGAISVAPAEPHGAVFVLEFKAIGPSSALQAKA